MTTAYDFTAETLTGKPADLADWRGQALLIVNTASKCGFTPQYAGLEALQKAYAGKGFSVLGFPCDQFGHQEPGGADEIGAFLRDQLRRQLPDVRQGGGERAGRPSPVQVPGGGQAGPPRLQVHQVELHQVPGGPERRGGLPPRPDRDAGKPEERDRRSALATPQRSFIIQTVRHLAPDALCGVFSATGKVDKETPMNKFAALMAVAALTVPGMAVPRPGPGPMPMP